MPEEEKFYLTERGLKRIKKEYEQLKRMKFTKTKDESPKILHSGDVNPEYLFFYEDLDLLETKLAELDNILRNAILITTPPKREKKCC